ncbi:MAG TPA: SMI1/KNR4 family protein [Chitinophagaceae bacterium]|nr:SMI1/KNR4 family protein [Chitinophagaceae bacterium]
MTKDQLYDAYVDMLGEPDERLDTGQGYDIVYALPIEEEGLEEGEIMTMGLSAVLQEQGCGAVELALYISEPDEEVYREIADYIASLVSRFIDEKKCFETGTDIRNVALPGFNSMNCLYLPSTQIHAPATLAGVPVIELAPLYEEEVLVLNVLPPQLQTLVFREAGGDWSDPQREPIALVDEALHNVWNDISQWYQENAPALHAQLEQGASDRTIKDLEALLQIALPPDYAASLTTCNGQVSFHSHKYLSAEQVMQNWKMMKELDDTGALGHGWWNKHWIPFAKDGGGNFICIDTEKSALYPIVYWDKEEGPVKAGFSCFLDWLANYRDALYQNRFRVNDEGFLEEKY